MNSVVSWRYWLWDCKGVSKMDCWCVCSGLCPVSREDGRIMRHNTAWDRASCRINPKLYPKPSAHSHGGHKVKSMTPDPAESLGLETRRSRRLSLAAADAGEGSAWDLLVVCLSVARCPGPCSSWLDFSPRSIYYLADLLKVISEPSGPARWPETGGLLSGQTDWKIQMDTVELLKHTGSKQTENTACIIQGRIHYRRNKSSSIFHKHNLEYGWMFN